MNIVKPTVTTLQQEPGIDGMYKIIAESAYICYQTDPEKAKFSPKEFIEKTILPRKHYRPLEFGTVFLKIPYYHTYESTSLVAFFRHNNWSKVKFYSKADDPSWLITTNYRVIVENNLIDEMNMYWSESPLHHKRYLAEFVCSRGVSDDFRTHVSQSSLAESTRYCLYSQDKFNNELTFIEPYWKESKEQYDFTIDTFRIDEERYLIGAQQLNMQPQQLKRIYPLGGKTVLRLCGFKDAWENFFFRRCDSHADPECTLLAKELQNKIYL